MIYGFCATSLSYLYDAVFPIHLPTQTLIQLLAIQCLDYSNNLFSGLDKRNLALLITIQNAAAKVIFLAHCFGHCILTLHSSTSSSFISSTISCLLLLSKPFTAYSHYLIISIIFIISCLISGSQLFPCIHCGKMDHSLPVWVLFTYLLHTQPVLSPTLLFTPGKSSSE